MAFSTRNVFAVESAPGVPKCLSREGSVFVGVCLSMRRVRQILPGQFHSVRMLRLKNGEGPQEAKEAQEAQEAQEGIVLVLVPLVLLVVPSYGYAIRWMERER